MSNLNVNIGADAVMTQKAMEAEAQALATKKKENVFDVKNYLNTRLSDKETSKTLTIRLLPFSPEGGSPFHKVHMHTVRVNKEVSQSGWKTFPCPIHNNLGTACPFCETSDQAKKLKFSATDDQQKKGYGDIEYANKQKDMWIVRCIERGHEEDGVKFWLFAASKKGDGVYDKIMNIFTQRYNKALEQGRVNNIFDLNEGKDLLITVTKDTNNKTVINVADDDEKTPLSNDYDLALSWINDSKKWEDVYTVKPYQYMAIVMQGGVPKFDKTKNCYVDKEEAKQEAAEEVERNLQKASRDLSVVEVATPLGNVVSTAQNVQEEDDLPF